MKKLISLVLAMLMVLCLCVPAMASGEPSAAPSGEPSAEAAPASGETYPKFEEYKQYLLDTMLKDPFWQGNEALLRNDLAAAQTPYDENIQHFTGSGAVDQAPAGVVFPMTYDVWYAQNGGDASGEPAAQAPASGEPSGEASGESVSVQDAFIEYIHQWLIAEDAINDTMTEEIRENEFMPLVRQMNFTDFPAEMIYSGMLESGVPMTFEEFAAQY